MGLLDNVFKKVKAAVSTATGFAGNSEVGETAPKKNGELAELITKLNENKANSDLELSNIIDDIKNQHDGETAAIKGILSEGNWEEDGVCSVEVFGVDEYICYHVQIETTSGEVPELHGEIVEATGVIGQTEQSGLILRNATLKHVPSRYRD